MKSSSAFQVQQKPRLWQIGAIGLVLIGLVIALVVNRERPAQIGLYSPTTRQADAVDLAWADASPLITPDLPYADMTRRALADLHALTSPNGATVAADHQGWDYVWPRDAAFVAAAMASAGHLPDAVKVLEFVQSVQRSDGWFEARYHPNGQPVNDGRERQLDSTGLVLWAAEQVILAAPDQNATRAQLAQLIIRSTTLLTEVIGPNGLPPASSDYWERPERDVTLETAAATLAGLQAVQRLADLPNGPTWTEPDQTRLADAIDRLSTGITTNFGPHYGRYPGLAQADAAITLLLPPFVTDGNEVAPAAFNADVTAAFTAAPGALARPAGGLAPGQAWPRDGISWTPETALFALARATCGQDNGALAWLAWLDSHRPASGSLPEKVLADGAPASVAPLGWTAALVVLTQAELAK